MFGDVAELTVYGFRAKQYNYTFYISVIDGVLKYSWVSDVEPRWSLSDMSPRMIKELKESYDELPEDVRVALARYLLT